MEIKVLARQGRSIRDIAREMQVSRNTVRRYLRDEAAAQMKSAPARRHKLDPYRHYLSERVRAAHPAWLPATVLLAEIVEQGYAVGLSRLRAYLRSLRAVKPAEPVVRVAAYQDLTKLLIEKLIGREKQKPVFKH